MLSSDVPLEGVALAKAHVTCFTLVGPLTCMHPLVMREFSRVTEAALADGALVGFASRVGVLMALQVGSALESLATCSADMRLAL